MSFEFFLKEHILSIALFLSFTQVLAQTPDSVKQLNEVVVQGYLSRQPIIKSPASAIILDTKALTKNSQQSLLPAVNSVPGIRMEERSPGSYRLSIRGSLLRSPFGIRNVKVYLHDLPFTDASGNTYLNLIDPVLIKRIEILKGPDGSLFGANSGGVALLNLTDANDSSSISGSISGGSYGMVRQSVAANQSIGNFQWSIGQAFQRADGYRDQSFMKRLNGFVSGDLRYHQNNKLKLLLLYSDLRYETPGGLTKTQFKDDPSQARPAAGPNPGAAEQQAGIYNKTFFGGITNEFEFSSSWKHVISVFGTHTNYKNPFITNYEIRAERNAGLRSYLEYIVEGNNFNFQWNTGLEGQWGKQEISNYENTGGAKGALSSDDAFNVRQVFYFTRASVDVGKLAGEFSVSLNQYHYHVQRDGSRNLSNEWMPRIGLSYRVTEQFALRISASRGYSTPTIAEIRPSGSELNNNLHAEYGWNREIGFRFATLNNRFQLDASVFRFDLENAIVRRTDVNDAEFFLNAGGTNQKGVEFVCSAWVKPLKESGLLRGLELKASFTYNNFTFDDYQSVDSDFSGNALTGVPEHVIVNGLTFYFPESIQFFIQSNLTSRIPLNDANSEYASKYHLIQARLNWATPFKQTNINLFVGGDNLLNEAYSLGNDINAFGGRYYNAAPLRNFYMGVTLVF